MQYNLFQVWVLLCCLYTPTPQYLTFIYIELHEKGMCKYMESMHRRLDEVHFWTDKALVQELVGVLLMS